MDKTRRKTKHGLKYNRNHKKYIVNSGFVNDLPHHLDFGKAFVNRNDMRRTWIVITRGGWEVCNEMRSELLDWTRQNRDRS